MATRTFKGDDFNERRQSAAGAKQAMLAAFRERAKPDDPVVLQRQAERQATAANREARQAERKAAREAAEAAAKVAEGRA